MEEYELPELSEDERDRVLDQCESDFGSRLFSMHARDYELQARRDKLVAERGAE